MGTILAMDDTITTDCNPGRRSRPGAGPRKVGGASHFTAVYTRSTAARRALAGGAIAALVAWSSAAAATPGATVHLEELTWTELRERVAGGAITVLIPVGGTEQNGPHMALGKHNVRGRLLAERIAVQLGNAVVAPVVAYVPEGNLEPPTQHMRYPGTISIPEPVFEATLVAAARSLRRHGLCHVVLLGEHGGYRASLDRVAATVNRIWAPGSACRVHALHEYYRASQAAYPQALQQRGASAAEIGSHAGLADTSLTLALAPMLVRVEIAASRPPGGAADGVVGDPRRASAEFGRLGVDRIVEASVAAIRARTRSAP